MPRRNAPEKKFSAVRGCPRSCARTNPWFRGQILGEKRAQEPPSGSAVKHCWFLGTGGGGDNGQTLQQTAFPSCEYSQVLMTWLGLSTMKVLRRAQPQ